MVCKYKLILTDDILKIYHVYGKQQTANVKFKLTISEEKIKTMHIYSYGWKKILFFVASAGISPRGRNLEEAL